MTFYLILIALVQGATEFLPISSSAHLILLPYITDATDQGQMIDVAAHVGTLCAVVVYFWSDVKLATSGIPHLLRGNIEPKGARLAFCLCISAIPVILVGLLIKLSGIEDMLRSAKLIGWTMLVFGIVLYWADRTGGSSKNADNWGPKDALAMGLYQTIALIPGTSRSGITITAARKLGYERRDAARLSMLMSIPAIIASGVLVGYGAFADANATAMLDAGITALLSFFAALAALKLMMHFLRSVSYTPYVIYRVILGLVLLFISYA